MNIKEHIEAGHYPKDAGVTTVATRGGSIAYIYTTKHHPDWPIVGGIEGDGEPFAWRDNGRITSVTGVQMDDERDLLPPSPRKVKRFAAVHRGALCNLHFYESDGPAQREIDERPTEFALITMEYEELWP